MRTTTTRAARAALFHVTLASAMLTGCLGVEPPEGRLACASSAECPAEWVCRADSRCYRTAGDVDASTLDGGRDAQILDGDVADADRPDGALECTLESECDDSNACTVDDCDNSCLHEELDCDDGFACTVDDCSVTGGCAHTSDDAACAAGRTCDPAGAGADAMGCVLAPDCDDVADCEDGDFCTDDACVGGACSRSARTCTDDASACTLPAMCNELMDACVNAFDPSSLTSVDHCGTTAAMCVAPCPSTHATRMTVCMAGTCGERCMVGRVDVDGNAANGCECMTSGTGDPPDDTATDANCDGADGIVGAPTPHVYVTPTGAGSHDGTSPADAATITEAFDIANGGPRRTLLVASGEYTISMPLAAPNNLSVLGGYAPDFRSRTGTSRVISMAPVAIRFVSLTSATVDSVSFETADRTTAGQYTHTVDIVGSSGVVLRRLTIAAGAGGPGASGMTGGIGSGGPSGPGGNLGSGGTGGSGGGSGSSRGGNGGSIISGAPQAGATGADASVAGPGCGRGGGGGTAWTVTTSCPSGGGTEGNPGMQGNIGCLGATGGSGGAGGGAGSIGPGAMWMPASAGAGAAGMPGGDGAGGGGGGAFRC
ncbi:MAG: hypothetical protein M3Y87_24835, partial [Myxococcota bacterium]|nr:hypothetical protein [Myxococcota bacterium]